MSLLYGSTGGSGEALTCTNLFLVLVFVDHELDIIVCQIFIVARLIAIDLEMAIISLEDFNLYNCIIVSV